MSSILRYIEKITIDEATKLINVATPSEVIAVAHNCINQLSRDDQLVAGGDLEASAFLIAGDFTIKAKS